MKTLNLLTVALAILVGNASAQVTGNKEKSEGWSTGSSFQFQGKVYKYDFYDRDLKNTPSWRPGDGEPPLSAHDAAVAAREYLPRFVAKAEAWYVDQIQLIRGGGDKWYYDVRFEITPDYDRKGIPVLLSPAGGFPILLKMDGSLIAPLITPGRTQ